MEYRNRTWIVCAAIIIALTGFSCGYHFSSGGEHIDSSIQTVFVEKFQNRTSESNLENYVQNAFVNEFRRGSRFDLADSKERADAIITGSIKRASLSHLSYTSSDVAKENRVNLTMAVTFKTNKSNNIIWNNDNLTGNEAFLVDFDPSRTDANKEKALRKLVVDMAERAYRSIMSGF